MTGLYSKHRITELISKEYRQFPLCRWQDIYKLFYLDYFGPAHLNQNKCEMIKYLKFEMANFTPGRNYTYIDDISCFNEFLRIDLNWIITGKIALKQLADAFWRSSKFKLYQPVSWQKHWANILNILKQLNIESSESEITQLNVLAKQEVTTSHSQIYKDHYHPHYRIIERNIWNELVRNRNIYTP